MALFLNYGVETEQLEPWLLATAEALWNFGTG
jgi:hypothetical protein